MLLPPEMWFFVESVPGSKDRTAYPQLFLFPFPQTTYHPNPPENVVFCGKCTRYRNTAFGPLARLSTLKVGSYPPPSKTNYRRLVNLTGRDFHPLYVKATYARPHYRVQKIGQLNTLSSYSLSHKQIISHSPRKCGLLRKMYPVPQYHCYTTFITVVKVLFLVKVNKLA